MKRTTGFNFLLGVLLTGSTVVADGVSNLATGDRTPEGQGRRVSSVLLHASATDASSATTTHLNRSPGGAITNALPPLPAGVSELKFSEFFRQPIGPRGLEYTDRLRSLEGRRIRILGFMVRQTEPTGHCFLLANRPFTVNEEEYGLCDDLPANTIHVFTTADAPAQTPFTPGPLLLTGTLSVSNRVEADGRVSTVRLFLDAPTAEQRLAAVAAAEAAARQPEPDAGHHH